MAVPARAHRPADRGTAAPPRPVLRPAALVALAGAASLTALAAALADGGPLAALSLLGAACSGAALHATWTGTTGTPTGAGLLDRAGLDDAGEALLAAARRHGYPVTAVVATLDDPDGARLTRVGRAWRDTARRGDLLARLDDVFVLLLPGTTPDAAGPLLARLHAAVDVPWRAGLSLAEPEDDLESLLARARADLDRPHAGRGAVERRLPLPRPAIGLDA